jgi:hypothetical protein
VRTPTSTEDTDAEDVRSTSRLVALEAGMNKAPTPSVTLGPKGRRRAGEEVGRPTITNDGVSIAKEIDLEDPYEKIRPARQGGRQEDRRRGRGRHDDRHGAGVVDGARGPQRGRRRQPDEPEEGHRGRGRRSGRVHQDQAKDADNKDQIAQVASISAAARRSAP